MSVNFHIKTKNIDLTPEVSQQIHDKLAVVDKLLSTDGDQEVLAEVEVGLRSKHHNKGDVYRSEANVTHNGALYRASARGTSITDSLDQLKDEISKVIRRNTGKRADMGRAGGRLLKKLLRR